MLIILKRRHRLLHMRASLERKCSQARRYPIYIGPSFNSRIRIIKKGRLHGHRYGKTPQQKEYHQARNFKKRCIKKHFKGFTIASWEILNFVHPRLEHDRDEELSKWTILRTRMSLMTWRNQNIFDTNRIGGSPSLKTGNTTGPMRKRSDFNQALSTLNRLHQRIWRTTTQAHAILEVSATAPIIELFLQLVAMECFSVEFIIIQRKSSNEDACKAIW